MDREADRAIASQSTQINTFSNFSKSSICAAFDLFCMLSRDFHDGESTTGLPVIKSDISTFLFHARALIDDRRIIGISTHCTKCADITNGAKFIGGK